MVMEYYQEATVKTVGDIGKHRMKGPLPIPTNDAQRYATALHTRRHGPKIGFHAMEQPRDPGDRTKPQQLEHRKSNNCSKSIRYLSFPTRVINLSLTLLTLKEHSSGSQIQAAQLQRSAAAEERSSRSYIQWSIALDHRSIGVSLRIIDPWMDLGFDDMNQLLGEMATMALLQSSKALEAALDPEMQR
jgi:hypothetical protein